MKAKTALDKIKSKTKPKPKARKPAKKAATVIPQNHWPDPSLPIVPGYIPGETEEQRKKRLAARKALTLKVFQMFYDTYHAGKSNWDF